MSPSLPAQFFQDLTAELVADVRRAIAVQSASKDPVYGFVVYYHPLFGDVGWLFHSEATASTRAEEEFSQPPGHPDGRRFDIGNGEAFELADLSQSTTRALKSYTEHMELCGYDGPSEKLEAALIATIKALDADFSAMRVTEDFVAFVADVEGADVELVRQTISPSKFAVVFPDA